MCVCWLFVSSKRSRVVIIIQRILRYFTWWALSNWHTKTNYLKMCNVMVIFETTIQHWFWRAEAIIFHITYNFFLIIGKSSQALKDVPETVQNCINAVNIYDSDSIMSCCSPITLVENNLKNIYLGGPLWYEFTYEYYNGRNDAFGLLFKNIYI